MINFKQTLIRDDTELQADVYWSWVVKRAVTLQVSDLEAVREARGLIAGRDHRGITWTLP